MLQALKNPAIPTKTTLITSKQTANVRSAAQVNKATH